MYKLKLAIMQEKMGLDCAVGNVSYRLTYSELNKIMSDAEGEIRDYLGEEYV